MCFLAEFESRSVSRWSRWSREHAFDRRSWRFKAPRLGGPRHRALAVNRTTGHAHHGAPFDDVDPWARPIPISFTAAETRKQRVARIERLLHASISLRRAKQVGYGRVWHGRVGQGRVGHGMVGHGRAWYGTPWYGMV